MMNVQTLVVISFNAFPLSSFLCEWLSGLWQASCLRAPCLRVICMYYVFPRIPVCTSVMHLSSGTFLIALPFLICSHHDLVL